MSRLLPAIPLALLWAALWGDFSWQNLLAGLVLSLLALAICTPAKPAGRRLRLASLPHAILLLLLFLKEMVKSCLLVARDCIAPRPRLYPGIITLPLDVRSDAEIFLLSSLITLTPGTLTLAVATDRSHLRIHALDARDPQAVVEGIKSGFEQRVRKVFQP